MGYDFRLKKKILFLCPMETNGPENWRAYSCFFVASSFVSRAGWMWRPLQSSWCSQNPGGRMYLYSAPSLRWNLKSTWSRQQNCYMIFYWKVKVAMFRSFQTLAFQIVVCYVKGGCCSLLTSAQLNRVTFKITQKGIVIIFIKYNLFLSLNLNIACSKSGDVSS